jgi:hypothetical protein
VNVTAKSFLPVHPLERMTTGELAAFRSALEDALSLSTPPPHHAPRETLQKRLDAVLEEQADRERIADRAKAAAHSNA